MKILLISGDMPVASSGPGSPRVFSLFRHITRRHEVDLATFDSSVWSVQGVGSAGRRHVLAGEEGARIFRTVTILRNPQQVSFWGRQWHRLVQAPFFLTRYLSPEEFRSIRGRILDLIEEKKPDLLFIDRLPAAQYILDVRSIPRVVDAHDAASRNFHQRARYAASRAERLRLLLESHSIRRFEVLTARSVDAYVVNSPVDRQILERYHRNLKVLCLPNGVDAEYFSPSAGATDDRTLVFTGVMSYPPNRDAVRFFCTHVLPRIRRAVPDIRLEVVGSNPAEDVRGLSGNGVTVTGTVPDVRPYLRRAAVYVSPLRFGTGVKNKVLAALAMEKAVVATPESCSGLDVIPGKHLLVARNPEEFAAQIVRLLADVRRRCELGSAGRKLVVERYRWDVIAKQLEEVLEQLTAPTGASLGSGSA